MQRIEVKSHEYKVLNAADNLMLYTRELNDDIACSIFSKKLKKVALARNIDNLQLKQMMQELNPDNVLEPSLLTVQLIGGENGSEKSQNYLKQFIESLEIIDNRNNIINIIVSDTGAKWHPNSFELDCYHGGIRALGEESFAKLIHS